MEYIVIEANNREMLEKLVNDKIKGGYLPTTHLSVASSSTTVECTSFSGHSYQKAEHRTTYVQGMIKKN